MLRDPSPPSVREMLDPALLDQSLDALATRVSAHYAVDEEALLRALMAIVDHGEPDFERIAARTRSLIQSVRSRENAIDGIDRLLREYSLDTQEGVILMCLAEALLRIPDARTADALIEDKLSVADWERHLGRSDSLLVNASTWGLLLTGKVVRMDKSADGRPASLIGRIVNRLGEPVIRAAMSRAMKLMGQQFVLGRTIEEALKNAKPQFARGYTYSFDMLGEAARTREDAERYERDYHAAIEAVGKARTGVAAEAPAPSVSVKLSALHPRYERGKRERVLKELGERLGSLVARAREADVALTLDAEEADRLELSLALFEQAVRSPAGQGWGRLGLVVQAYSKRALPVLQWTTRLAIEMGDEIPVRLVKGAYWDSEIKHAQMLGVPSYPVFTRKAGTDASYLACARYLLSDLTRGRIFPQFATHNAHTLVTILDMAGGRSLEFQRLHGMGEALYEAALEQAPAGTRCRIYAPVGAHKDLLPYLVRRLLENGANSSFVHQLVDPRVPVESLCRHPLQVLAEKATLANPRIPLPPDLYGAERRNSRGVNLAVESQLQPLLAQIHGFDEARWMGGPLIAADLPGDPALRREVTSPFDTSQVVGEVQWADEAQVRAALDAAVAAFPGWNAMPVAERAGMLRRAADLLESHMGELMALCAREAGKQLRDGVAEVREAVDFCRYYAAQGERAFAPVRLPGPTGESNELYLTGRGVFVAISPWNFPVAIFVGQIAAALAAGNSVIAKPAAQTSLVAWRCVQLMHEAGIPRDVLQFLPGGGATVGRLLTADPRVAGIVFTGSTETAQTINRTLAARDNAPLAAFIAETGGQNAMIVDSTALPEQVVTDVVESAFNSTGQRCSALRVLVLQEEIADRVIRLLKGAMDELQAGDPRELATDVGPVIDADARAALQAHVEAFRARGRVIAEAPLDPALAVRGHFLAPVALALESMDELDREHFGPVLHVLRYPSTGLDAVIDAINGAGYGLTLGIQSRNESFAEHIDERVRIGNVYVNRNIIGAVVGVQPFGGMGLSGTGPKAGGPHYLTRFATERTRTINTAAIGGNASLLAQGED